MGKIIALIFLSLLIVSCASVDVDHSEKMIKNQPKVGLKGIKVKTINRGLMKKLGLDSDRAILGGVSGDDLFFIGIDGNSFDFDPKPPMGKLVNEYNIKVYQNSPNCYFIEPGNGTGFWYPWGCPQ